MHAMCFWRKISFFSSSLSKLRKRQRKKKKKTFVSWSRMLDDVPCCYVGVLSRFLFVCTSRFGKSFESTNQCTTTTTWIYGWRDGGDREKVTTGQVAMNVWHLKNCVERMREFQCRKVARKIKRCIRNSSVLASTPFARFHIRFEVFLCTIPLVHGSFSPTFPAILYIRSQCVVFPKKHRKTTELLRSMRSHSRRVYARASNRIFAFACYFYL